MTFRSPPSSGVFDEIAATDRGVLDRIPPYLQSLEKHPVSRLRLGLKSEIRLIDAMKYTIAEAFYRKAWAPLEESGNRRKSQHGWRARAKGALDAAYAIQQTWREKIARTAPPDIAACGFLNPSGPIWASVPLRELSATAGVTVTALDYRDLRTRWGKRRLAWRLPTIPSTQFLTSSDFRKARRLAREARSYLGDLPGDFPDQAYRLSLQLSATERFLKESRPRRIVIPDERFPLARAIALTARAHGIAAHSIPDLCDGFLLRVPLLEPLAAQHYLTPHPLVRERLISLGFGSTEVRLARSEDFENAFNSPPPPASLRRRILFTCQGRREEPAQIARLANALSKNPDWELAVRPHPRLSPPPSGKRWLMDRSTCPQMAVAASQCVITCSSMMAVRASLAGKPVIVWNPDGCPELLPLLDYPRAAWAASLTDVQHALDRLSKERQGDLETAAMREIMRQAARLDTFFSENEKPRSSCSPASG